jgi:hypothetical protein
MKTPPIFTQADWGGILKVTPASLQGEDPERHCLMKSECAIPARYMVELEHTVMRAFHYKPFLSFSVTTVELQLNITYSHHQHQRHQGIRI